MLIEFSKNELQLIATALEESGLEFANNLAIHEKISNILDKMSISSIK
jgi:hypothetical protein